MVKKHIWREGQRFRIKESRLVKRVGYELHPNDIASTISDEDVVKAMKAIGLEPQISRRATNKVRDALAFAVVSAKGFGSRKRKIIYWDWDTFLETQCQPFKSTKDYYAAGTEHVVFSVKRSWIGDYYAPSGGFDEWSGDYDYEPGGLDNRKLVVLLNYCHVGGGRDTMSINAEDVEFIL